MLYNSLHLAQQAFSSYINPLGFTGLVTAGVLGGTYTIYRYAKNRGTKQKVENIANTVNPKPPAHANPKTFFCAQSLPASLGHLLFTKKASVDSFSEKDRIQQALNLATKKNTSVARIIHSFTITDATARLDIAKEAAKNNPKDLVLHIRNFAIEAQEDRYDLAYLLVSDRSADSSVLAIAKNIRHFDLSDEQRFNIAIEISKRRPYIVLKHIESFNISEESNRFLIAKHCLHNHSFLHNFSTLKDAGRLSRFTEFLWVVGSDLASGNGPSPTRFPGWLHWLSKQRTNPVDYISRFHLTESKYIQGLAEIAADVGQCTLAYHIPGFDNISHADKVSLAHRLVRAKGVPYFTQLKDFTIESEEERFQLALAVADNRYSQLGAVIQYYSLSNNEHLYQLALKLAESQPLNLLFNLNKFKLTEKQRKKVAKIIGKRCPESASQFIGLFGLKKERYRLEVALAIISQAENAASGRPNLGLGKYIQNFSLSERSRYQVALEFAKKRSQELASSLKAFDLDDSEIHFRIAFMMVNSEDKQQARYGAEALLNDSIWNNFHITNKKQLQKLARLCAKVDGYAFLSCDPFTKFNIDSEDEQYTLLKAAIESNNYGSIRCLANFMKPFDQERRFELACAAAKAEGELVHSHFEDWGIEENNERFVKALLASQGLELNEFHLYGQKERYELANNLRTRHSKWVLQHWSSIKRLFEFNNHYLSETITQLFNIEYKEHYWPDNDFFNYLDEIDKDLLWNKMKENYGTNKYNYSVLQNYKFTEESAKKLLTNFLIDLSFTDKFIQKIIEKIKKTPQIQRDSVIINLHHFFLHYYVDTKKGVVEEKIIRPWIENSSLVETIISLRKPNERLPLLNFLKNLYFCEKFRCDFLKIKSGNAIDTVFVALNALKNSGLPLEMVDQIQIWIKSSKKIFKDNNKVQFLVELLITIKKLEIGIQESILRLILQLHNTPSETRKIITNISIILSLLTWKEEKKLQTIKNKEELDSAFFTAFRNKVPCDEIEDFTSKYETTFGNFRQPEALITYSSNQQHNPEVQQALKSFITAVLSGTYPQMRYDNSKHLNQIRAHVIEQWRTPVKFSIEELSINQQEQPVRISCYAFLQDKLEHNHFSKDQFPLLVDAIDSIEKEVLRCKSNEVNEVIKAVVKEYKIRLVKIKKEKETAEEKRFRQIESWLLQLLDETSGEKNRLKIIAKIRGTCAEHEILDDLSNDLDELSHFYNSDSKDERQSDYIVFDTDDANDALLIGTEVAGSCQRVAGKPTLNRALMAYLIDGKNRMIVLKEKEKGSIIARAILRILIDKDKQPVLFIENIYPSFAQRDHMTAITELAKRKAQVMQLPLFDTPNNTERDSGNCHRLSSLSCQAPFEYVDANRAIETNTWSTSGRLLADYRPIP